MQNCCLLPMREKWIEMALYHINMICRDVFFQCGRSGLKSDVRHVVWDMYSLLPMREEWIVINKDYVLKISPK